MPTSPGSPPICLSCGQPTSATRDSLCPRCIAQNISAFLPRDDPATHAVAPPTQPFPYHNLAPIGQGAMSRVYSAQHRTLGRIVALKVLNRNATLDPAHLLRFRREAQTIACLRHPHIITLHEHGLTPEGAPFLAMDLVSGGDLAHRLRSRPYSLTDAVELIRKIALALDYTHQEGVLHRDLKPSNILLDGEEPLLADFGLAAQLDPGGDLTAATAILGTPHYLAPELLLHGSANATPASDLYALGIILYEMLTGRTPHAGATPAQLPHLVATQEPIPPRQLAPNLPRDIETICLKCIEREPARRYVSAKAFAADLNRFLDGQPIQARPPGTLGRFTRWCRRSPALATIWFLLVALLGVSRVTNRLLENSRSELTDSLAQTRAAETTARERLREARHAEARALLSTRDPARRTRIFAALKEAAAIRPDLDLRNTALAALLQPELTVTHTWDLQRPPPAKTTVAPGAQHVAFEPTDASGLRRLPAQLINRDTTVTRATLEIPGAYAVGSLRYSRDGQLILCRYSDSTLRLWRATDATLLLTVPNRPLPGGTIHTEPRNNDYDLSSDATRFVLGLPDGGFALHRTSDASEITRFQTTTRYDQIRFAPDGRHLVAARLFNNTPRSLQIFPLPTPDTLGAPLTPPDHDQAECYSWSSDGQHLALGLTNRTITLYSPQLAALTHSIASPARQHLSIDFLADNTLLAVRTRGSTRLHILNLALNHEEFTLPDVGLRGPSLWLDRHRFTTANQQNLVTDWQIDPAIGFNALYPPNPAGFQTLAYGGSALAFSTHADLVATAHGRHIVLYDSASHRHLLTHAVPALSGVDISTLAFVSPGKLLRCSTLDGLKLHAVSLAPTPQITMLATLDPEPGFIIADFHRDHALLLNHTTGDCKILHLRDGQPTRQLSRWQTPGAFGGALSPDATQVLINTSGIGADSAAQRIQLRRTADAALLRSLEAPVCCDIVWSRDGRHALSSNGQSHYLWDTATWTPRKIFGPEYGGALSTFAISPDCRHAAILYQTRITLIDLSTGETFASLDLPGILSSIVTLSFSPDSNELLALWRDGRIDRLDLPTLNQALFPLGLNWNLTHRQEF